MICPGEPVRNLIDEVMSISESTRMSAMASDRVVVITGASVGIGGATTARMLADGWRVVGVDIDTAGFESMATEFPGMTAVVDGSVADRETHEHAVQKALELGTLYGWVNNAGTEKESHAHDFVDEDWDLVMNVNCRGVAYGCTTALGSFLAQGVKGVIVNVSSIRGRVSFPGGFAYEASKGAIEMMTKSIAVEYGPRGIRCNGVRPGAILTPLAEKTDLAGATGEERDALIRSYGRIHPLEHRIGMPDEVADVIAFLLSDDARLVSGELINVDGAARARCYPADD